MLGLGEKSTYEEWTALFDPTSTYDGNWNKGSKILFISTDDNGQIGGMVSRVLENTPNHFVSIQHYGVLKAGEEVTEGDEVDDWADGIENYFFEESDGITTVSVELDATEEFEDYMNGAFPKALLKLKEICERINR